MKKLLILLALTVAAFTAQAQTNISLRVQVDGVNYNLNLDSAGSKKDQARLAGINYAYSAYTNSLATNVVALAKGQWLLNNHTILIDDYKDQKQRADNTAMLAKIQYLLTSGTDLLDATDMNRLATIAAKAP